MATIAGFDLQTIGIALLGGVTPALLWIWFWLKEDKENHEPHFLLILVFIAGALGVIFAIPIERYINARVSDQRYLIGIWAGIEEVIKFIAVWLIALKSREIDEPVDFPIYFMICALGFAALENTLFLLRPELVANSGAGLLTSNLRYLGATLLHAISSGIVGISIGLAFYQNRFMKQFYFVVGLGVAISLHGLFNFFIMNDSGGNFLQIFGLLWVTTIIIMLLFEKLRRMKTIN